MKITFKYGNEVITYPTIKEAKKFLNEANYYCEKVHLSGAFSISEEYTLKTDLASLQRDAVNYGEGWINVYCEH